VENYDFKNLDLHMTFPLVLFPSEDVMGRLHAMLQYFSRPVYCSIKTSKTLMREWSPRYIWVYSTHLYYNSLSRETNQSIHLRLPLNTQYTLTIL
jgi:hypothetical protein